MVKIIVQNNTLFLDDLVFEDFKNMCIKMYELDPSKCLSASR